MIENAVTPCLPPDQMLRLECLRICGGSVAEAKNAYFWINGEGRQHVGTGSFSNAQNTAPNLGLHAVAQALNKAG